MQLRKTILASVFSAALALSAAACGTAENTQSVCSAAASEHVAETPTPSPEGEGSASINKICRPNIGSADFT